MVGRANGRSMIVSRSRRPGILSRTSTQAIVVPMNRLISATSADATTVSFKAAQACGAVIWAQKPLHPSPAARCTTAASGIKTTTLRKRTTKPPDSAVPSEGLSTLTRNPVGRALLASCDTKALFDLRHGSVVRVEELRHHGVPAAELGDGEQPGRRREVHRGVGLHDGPVAVVR